VRYVDINRQEDALDALGHGLKKPGGSGQGKLRQALVVGTDLMSYKENSNHFTKLHNPKPMDIRSTSTADPYYPDHPHQM
jgi:hypothetical protein